MKHKPHSSSKLTLFLSFQFHHYNITKIFRVIQLGWKIGSPPVSLSSLSDSFSISPTVRNTLLYLWSKKTLSSLSNTYCKLKMLAVMPLNKQLYSFSYICVTSGAAALVFSSLYSLVILVPPHGQLLTTLVKFCRRQIYCFISLWLLQVDILEWKLMFLPLKWIGMNAMLVYVMGAEGILAAFFNGWYYRDPRNTLVKKIQLLNLKCLIL